jgi:hypothetical protein
MENGVEVYSMLLGRPWLKDVFAWSYKELKGIPREICEHKIELMVDDQPIKQRQYKMNPNYALKVREDLDKLLDVKFIYPIKTP